MKVYTISPRGFAANAYLITADEKTALCIDPAQPSILSEAEKRGLQVKYVLLTHGHFDHIGGVSALQQAGAKAGCLDKEQPLVLGKENLAEAFGVSVPPFSVDFTLKDGEKTELCGISVSVLATPGHTAGSCCYLIGENLFTGDTLFAGSVGRTDFPTGSFRELEKSVKKLYALAGNYKIYAGHGEETTLEHERKFNGYIKA